MNENEHTADPAAGAEASERAEEQGLLFTDDVSPLPSDTGYRSPTACSAAGIAVPDEQEDEVEKFRAFLDEISPDDFLGGNAAPEQG